MRLEINRNLISETADIETVKALVRDFPPQSEVMLTLWATDDEYIQAAGVPSNGFRMTYANRDTGRELVSTNQKLKQRTVMVVFDHFVAGSPNWRSDIGWAPANAQAAAVERRASYSRALPVIVALVVFALAFTPFTVVTRIVADDLVFKPMCAQENVEVSHFSHGSGGDVGGSTGSYTPPTCWYVDNSSVPLGTLIGDARAATYDMLLVAAEIVVPTVLIGLLLLVIFRSYFARRRPKARLI